MSDSISLRGQRAVLESNSDPPIPGVKSDTHVRRQDMDFISACLEMLVEKNSVQDLEAAMDAVFGPLHDFKTQLQAFSSQTQVRNFDKKLKELTQEASPQRVILGVVDNTGSGKSTVINALVDEELLVPTNCMRACTAVVTELSYNYSMDPHESYRAEIEFITHGQWRAELELLLSDLIDDQTGKVSQECTNQDTDAGIAWAKLKAVYPQHTKEMLETATIDELMKYESIQHALGATKSIRESSAKDLYRGIQRYVDSQDKSLLEMDKTGPTASNAPKRKKKPTEFWPLIEVVRIYIKADALSTGAVIVDLPGVQDANAARGNVAAQYLAQCTGLWVVAPIQRAVDDKVAKNLLGESFKMQLKFDGTFSNITFICSKTDDILVSEAEESLGLKERHAQLWVEIELKNSELDNLIQECSKLERELNDLAASLTAVVSNIRRWETLSDEIQSGATLYAPVESPTKRKRSSVDVSTAAAKRARQQSGINELSDDSFSDDESEAGATEETTSPDSTEPLTAEFVKRTLEEYVQQERSLRDGFMELRSKCKATRKQKKQCSAQIKAMKSQIQALCIQERNRKCGSSIRYDFVSGVKEFDQEREIAQDETSFDPSQDLRDYNKVAQSLPVFCVSSRAYQQSRGRLKDEQHIVGFPHPEDSEVPLLQAHAKKQTEAGRIQRLKQFLDSYAQLLTSLHMWTVAGDPHFSLDTELSEETKLEELANADMLLQETQEKFRTILRGSVQEFQDTLSKNIYEKLDAAITASSQTAETTAEKWGARRDEGGLHYQTYKATCRHLGAYKGAAGFRDFNDELARPFKKALVGGWSRTFADDIPSNLRKLRKSLELVLYDLYNSLQGRPEIYQARQESLKLFYSQIKGHRRAIHGLVSEFRHTIRDFNTGANRECNPAIQDGMNAAYRYCTSESGTGSFSRMKGHIQSYISTSKDEFLMSAATNTKSALVELPEKLQESMEEKLGDIGNTIKDECVYTIVGKATQPATKEESEQVQKLLLQSKERLSRLFGEAPDRVVTQVADISIQDAPQNFASEVGIKVERD